MLHKLLQMLPEIAETERDAAARRYLDRVAGGWPEYERVKALNSVLDILGTETFRPLFSASFEG